MIDWNQYDESTAIPMKPGFELFLRKNCEYSRKRFIYKIAETKELDFLSLFDFSKLVCLDVGANIGYWTVHLGAKFNAKEIHSFEPDPTTFSILQKNIILNKQEDYTFAHPFAICDSEKIMKLYLLPGYSGDNRPYFIEGRPCIAVQGISIDQYVERFQVSEVDFIKIDIQGGESDALDGAVKTISRHKPVMMLEFSPEVSIDNGTGLRHRLLKLVNHENMKLFVIENNSLTAIDMNDLTNYEGNLFISTKDGWLMK